MAVTLEIKHTSRVIWAKLEDGSKAFIRYRVEDGIMKLLETYTPQQHRGKGVAAQLMKYAVELARENGWLVEPVCSYSIYYFIKHPEERDVLHPRYKEMSEEEMKKLFQERLEEEKKKD